MAETLVEEFSRLIKEYGTGHGSEKEEAWNLIADFAVENSLKICLALERTFPTPQPRTSVGKSDTRGAESRDGDK